LNKTVVITGASSGIGKALALEFAQRGYNLGLAARRLDKLESLRAEIALMPDCQNLQVEIIELDVNNVQAVGPCATHRVQSFESCRCDDRECWREQNHWRGQRPVE
jgi:short-subunit dehydrogenase